MQVVAKAKSVPSIRYHAASYGPPGAVLTLGEAAVSKCRMARSQRPASAEVAKTKRLRCVSDPCRCSIKQKAVSRRCFISGMHRPHTSMQLLASCGRILVTRQRPFEQLWSIRSHIKKT
eukprot:2809327-Pleurochrysis_carterae.AAC.5